MSRPEPTRNDSDQVAPSGSVPIASSVEPPPTSTTPTVPSSGWPSVRVAPRKASRASSLPSRISTSTPPSSRIAAANSSWLAAPRIAAVATTRIASRAELLDQVALLGDHARDLVDLLARDLAALQALAEAGERAPLEHLAEAAVLDVGDQHARRVGADVDAGAEHSLGDDVAIMAA